MADSQKPSGTREPAAASDHGAPLEGESQIGPAPAVAGADRMRRALRARLFETPAAGLTASSLGPSASAGADPPPLGPSSGTPEFNDRIGRFWVLDRIGSGGMGVVYRAYDPQLDRKVAIKVLHPDVHAGVANAPARLMREAQAMARLSHPNVITVHEVGHVGGQVFVAMELVDGVPLSEWLAQHARPWREVLDVFIKAGSGLAAAHRAELIHRDFKPDNVLLGFDGQVRVLDFGLACLSTDPTHPSEPSSDDAEMVLGGGQLTREGAIMGTPAYMSAEQYQGHAVSARSDQFSFCVALYEGLYGVRPFRGDTLPALAAQVISGQIRPTPTEARVPQRLLTALRTGLAADPRHRHPSMEALLTQLRRDPGRPWRRGAVVLGVGAVASLGTWALGGRPSPADACTDLEHQLEPVWNESTRQRVRAAIEGTGQEYAPRVAMTTVRLLDEYTTRWVGMATAACGAALVAQTDPDEYARRRRCLDQRLAEVSALVDAFGQPDNGMAEAAVKATASLTTGLTACADPHRLSAYEVVNDPSANRRLALAYATLARAKAQGALGHYERAIELATKVVDEAQASEAEPLEALGRLTRGTYREPNDQSELAQDDLSTAIDLAERHGDQGTRAQALSMLVYVIGQDRTRYAEALRLGNQARAVLDYIDADPLLMADLDDNLGVAARIQGKFETALELHRRSHERRIEVLGADHPEIGRSLLNIGITMGASGIHNEHTESYLRHALESFERSLGPHHPLVGTALTNLGNNLGRQGRFADALPLQTRALAILERNLGPDHVAVIQTVFNLGRVMQRVGDHQGAAQKFRRGLRVRQAQLPTDDPRLVGWLSHLARSELALGHLESAQQRLERALALRKETDSNQVLIARDRLRLAQIIAAKHPQRAHELVDRSYDALTPPTDLDTPVPIEIRQWLEEAGAWRTAHPRPRPLVPRDRPRP